MHKEDIFKRIDHTLLSPTATWDDILRLCDEAVTHHMASVCVPASYVGRIHDAFGPRLTVATVIGFPLGYDTTVTKLVAVHEALLAGAKECDVVVNLGDVKNGNFSRITTEIIALKKEAGYNTIKIIAETCYLTLEEKMALCECVSKGGADYIKTSTGFGTGGATFDDIRLFRAHLSPHVKIKASGGIKTREQMEAFIEAGADRLGTSGAIKALVD